MKGYQLVVELKNPEGETAFRVEVVVTPEAGVAALEAFMNAVIESAGKKAVKPKLDFDLSSIFPSH